MVRKITALAIYLTALFDDCANNADAASVRPEKVKNEP